MKSDVYRKQKGFVNDYFNTLRVSLQCLWHGRNSGSNKLRSHCCVYSSSFCALNPLTWSPSVWDISITHLFSQFQPFLTRWWSGFFYTALADLASMLFACSQFGQDPRLPLTSECIDLLWLAPCTSCTRWWRNIYRKAASLYKPLGSKRRKKGAIYSLVKTVLIV